MSAASVLAQANVGYLADRASVVTVTLPTTLSAGDIVRVSGIGGGGWIVAQQAGQSIASAGIATTTIGANWTSAMASHGWQTIAASADGFRLVAGVGGGLLYTSTDAGVSWTPAKPPATGRPLPRPMTDSVWPPQSSAVKSTPRPTRA